MEIPQPINNVVNISTQVQYETSAEFFTIQNDSEVSEIEPPAFSLSYEKNFKEILTAFIPKKTMNMAWQQRYFTLTPTRLIYYTSKEKNEVKGCFNLISLQEHNMTILQQYPILTLTASIKSSKELMEEKELLKLNIQRKEEFSKWRQGIKEILENIQNHNSKLYPKIHPDLVRNPQLKVTCMNFWNKITLSTYQLSSYAGHLDIIFFRSKHPGSLLQRLFMRSYYDHVAILLKNQFDQLFILEAIESRGVWVNGWEQLAPTFKDVYEAIGYRKLLTPENHKINQADLESYLNSLIGKKYELSFSKLMGNEEQEEKEESKESTYFCSELIADIYIKFGLIKDRKKNQFWPKDFQNQLKLEGGASLSPLMQIQFD